VFIVQAKHREAEGIIKIVKDKRSFSVPCDLSSLPDRRLPFCHFVDTFTGLSVPGGRGMFQ
jgi:hypothetical protein